MVTLATRISSYNEIFSLEYSLETRISELEGKKYLGYGVSVKMIDNDGEETITCIQDITSEREIANDLIQLLRLYMVSPMCLKMFVEDYLIDK